MEREIMAPFALVLLLILLQQVFRAPLTHGPEPNGFASSSQNPSFIYTTANGGTYTLQASAAGCTSTAYTNVISTTNIGQWTGNTSTDWSMQRIGVVELFLLLLLT